MAAIWRLQSKHLRCSGILHRLEESYFIAYTVLGPFLLFGNSAIPSILLLNPYFELTFNNNVSCLLQFPCNLLQPGSRDPAGRMFGIGVRNGL